MSKIILDTSLLIANSALMSPKATPLSLAQPANAAILERHVVDSITLRPSLKHGPSIQKLTTSQQLEGYIDTIDDMEHTLDALGANLKTAYYYLSILHNPHPITFDIASSEIAVTTAQAQDAKQIEELRVAIARILPTYARKSDSSPLNTEMSLQLRADLMILHQATADSLSANTTLIDAQHNFDAQMLANKFIGQSLAAKASTRREISDALKEDALRIMTYKQRIEALVTDDIKPMVRTHLSEFNRLLDQTFACADSVIKALDKVTIAPSGVYMTDYEQMSHIETQMSALSKARADIAQSYSMVHVEKVYAHTTELPIAITDTRRITFKADDDLVSTMEIGSREIEIIA